MRLLQSKILFLIFCLISITVQGQKHDLNADIILIKEIMNEKHEPESLRPFIYSNDSTAQHKANPLNLTFGGALFVYQNLISKHISASCLYLPGCSEFSKEAIKEYGLIKGIILSADRLTRCTRISATDLKHRTPDPITGRYSDPVSSYKFKK